MTEQRQAEHQLRDEAYANRGDVDDSFAEVLEPVRVSQMISLRLDGDMAAALRDLATRMDTTVSDLLRQAAAALLTQAAEPDRTFVYFEVKQAEEQTWRSDSYQTGATSGVVSNRDLIHA